MAAWTYSLLVAPNPSTVYGRRLPWHYPAPVDDSMQLTPRDVDTVSLMPTDNSQKLQPFGDSQEFPWTDLDQHFEHCQEEPTLALLEVPVSISQIWACSPHSPDISDDF